MSVETIEDARRLGLEIRREVMFYAVRPDGVQYRLNHDWKLEVINKKLDAMDKSAEETNNDERV